VGATTEGVNDEDALPSYGVLTSLSSSWVVRELT
jgi:hypothetical protein